MANPSALPSYLEIEPIIDLDDQTVPNPDEPGARISRIIADEKKLRWALFPDLKLTLYNSIRRGGSLSTTKNCLGHRVKQPDGKRPYVWLSYEEVFEKARNLARGMLKKNIAKGQNTLIGIYSINRPEWVITEHACYEYSMVNVPLYDTLGQDGVSFIIRQTNMQLIVVDKQSRLETLFKKIGDYKHLRYVVVMDEFDQSFKDRATEYNVEILRFHELIELGAAYVDAPDPEPPEENDLATICYTSGTTGEPKGAMLTHLNIVADCSSLFICRYAHPTKDDTVISYLPLAHMFERVVQCMVISQGGRIGFYGGDVKVLSEDMQELKPTIMPTVPRLLNRIYDRVKSQTAHNYLKRWIFNWALWSKSWDLDNRVVRTNSWWDLLVFNKIRNAMGGCMKLVITGSAPCAPEILTFIRAALGCVVLEGYGSTESVSAAAVSLEGDHRPGHCGPPTPCCTMKLVDVPEMNYFAKDNRGEVCIKGPIVFKGYYKEEAKTREALDEDGWLHTGDIGCWTEFGALQLLDRKKNIFKLSQGEYVAPEKLENIYSRCTFVQQIFVYGESLHNCVIAIVVPEFEVVNPAIAERFGMKIDNAEEICKKKEVIAMVMDQMKDQATETKLNKFEEVKAIYLAHEPFSVDNGLLTPTFKSKRLEIQKKYRKQLDSLYASVPDNV